MFTSHTITEAYQQHCQDCVAIVRHPQGLVAILADGAGGSGGGKEAADMFLMWVRAHTDRTNDIREPSQWVELLARLDQQISCADGESTGVVVALFENGLCGASVGDSIAWAVTLGTIDDLTCNQVRKPLLGSGRARPVAFDRPGFDGSLLLASDGLANYTTRQKIAETLKLEDGDQACRNLVNLVRLKSGALPDDVGVILCRRTRDKPNASHRSDRVPYVIS
jgi:serine/threonine protein phosphatase PrpC